MHAEVSVLTYIQASWVEKKVERKRNLAKNTKKHTGEQAHLSSEQSVSKRSKSTNLLHRHPLKMAKPTEDDDSCEKHLKALESEMNKEKPRDSILLPLMKSTFTIRISTMQDEDCTVSEVVSTYGALSHPSVVSYLFILRILQKHLEQG